MNTGQERSTSRRVLFVGALLAAVTFGGCLGGSERDGAVDDSGTKAERRVSTERPAEKSPELRLVQLRPMNGSGVKGVARLLLDGRRLGVDSIASGAVPGRMHMQHIHVPEGDVEGKCPTPAADADGDGFVSLEESVGSYGAPVVSLEPFPMPEGPDWQYEQVLTMPKGVELDRGVVVLHGLSVHGKYDELMPIACGVIDDDAEVREVALAPVNDSVIAGTARVALKGSELYAWISLAGYIEGREHMQHIHVPEGNVSGSCPTPELDGDHDGLISLEEGVPAYGAPAVSLEPFPAPTGINFEYSHTLRVPAGFRSTARWSSCTAWTWRGSTTRRSRSRAAPSMRAPPPSAHRPPAPAPGLRAATERHDTARPKPVATSSGGNALQRAWSGLAAAAVRSRSISTRRRILPDGDFGISSMISTARSFL